MRWLILFAVLFAIGCNKSPNHTTLATTPAPPAAADFDPTDGDRAVKWLTQKRDASEKATIQGNEVSKQKEAAGLSAELAKSKGTSVKWRVKVREVNQSGGVIIQPIEVVEPGEKWEGRAVRRHLRILPADSAARAFTAAPVFPTNPKSPDWIATLRPGDPLTLSGTVERIESASGSSWPEKDTAHVLVPFIVYLRDPILTRD